MYGIAHIFLLFIYCLLGIVILKKYNGYNPQFKAISLFAATIVFGDGLNVAFSFMGLSSIVYMRYQVLMNLGTFFIFLYRFGLTGRRKKIAQVIALQFVCIWIFIGFFEQRTNQWPIYLFLPLQLSYIFCSLLCLLELLTRNSDKPLQYQGVFWFLAGHFCFYNFSFVLIALRAFEGIGNHRQLHNDLIIYGNIVFYLVFVLAMILENNRYFAVRHDA